MFSNMPLLLWSVIYVVMYCIEGAPHDIYKHDISVVGSLIFLPIGPSALIPSTIGKELIDMLLEHRFVDKYTRHFLMIILFSGHVVVRV